MGRPTKLEREWLDAVMNLDVDAYERLVHDEDSHYFPIRRRHLVMARMLADRAQQDPDRFILDILRTMIGFDAQVLFRARGIVRDALVAADAQSSCANPSNRFGVTPALADVHLPRLERIEQHLVWLAKTYADLRVKMQKIKQADSTDPKVAADGAIPDEATQQADADSPAQLSAVTDAEIQAA